MTQLLAPGQPAPWFKAAALGGNPSYVFDTSAGRWQLLLLLGTAEPADSQAALALVAANRDLFDDTYANFFGVTVNPDDAAQGRIAQQLPGIRWFLDYDRAVSRQFRAISEGEGAAVYHPHWLLLDPMQRIRSVAAVQDGAAIMAELRAVLAAPAEDMNAPVLVVPGVLPPEVCRHLIDLYEAQGGEDSGFMREVDGVTVARLDYAHKRRSDCLIEDPQLIDQLKTLCRLSLVPMIKRAFQFDVTRIERFIVACYEGDNGGHFRAHRDNTTKGTAHRRFACTINLNAEDYDGGDLRFPEFGPRTYRAPTGGAVVFSCSMLHEARPVTRGKRYAFLPFFYDNEGARIREANMAHISPEFQGYRSGLSNDEEAQG